MFYLTSKKSLGLLKNSVKRYKATLKQYNELNHAVSEAEKIVGYPTSFLNLRWLLSDELANVAMHFRKLIETNHPIMETARKLFIGNNTVPAWGLIVLLISNAVGLNANFPDNAKDTPSGILHSQRALAEVTEMIRTSNLLHKSLLNIGSETKSKVDLNLGNKISLLSGDYLLSRSFHELACLRNQNLNELMSSALRDLADAEFIGPRDDQDMPLPNRPMNLVEENSRTIVDHFDTEPYNIKDVLGDPYAEWTLRNILGGASLLGKSCQGAVLLANHSKETQELGYLFGKNLALAWQAQLEQKAFAAGSSGMFSLVSAPVMIHLHYNASLYEAVEKGTNDVSHVDYDYLRTEIQKGCALEKTRELQEKFSDAALEVLNKLSASDARTALVNIINTML